MAVGTGGWWEGVGNAPGTDVALSRAVESVLPSGMEQCPPIPGMGIQLPPRGPDIPTSTISRIIYPPRIEKLQASVDFSARNYNMALAAGIGNTVASPVLSFTVPTGQVGWLQQFSLYTLTQTAATTVQWTVRINGGPVPGFDAIQNPPGIANFVYITADDMRVRVPGGATVDVLITNVGVGGPWVVGGDLAGWYHPESAEQRAWGLDV